MEAPVPHRTDALLAEAGFVHRLARALLRDADVAHDVAQDVLLAAWQQRRGSQPRQLRDWLAAVTRRLARRAWHAQRERPRREAARARPEADDGEQSTGDRLLLHRRLCDAVLALPEPYRTAVTLRYLDGLSPRAIAQRRGLRAETVRQHVHRGLRLLRQRLDAEFGERRGWTAAFGLLGLGGSTVSPLISIPVLAMKKLAAAVLLVISFGVWWVWQGQEPPKAAPLPNDPPPARSAQEAAPSERAAATAETASDTALQRVAFAFAARVVDEHERPLSGVKVRCWPDGGEVVVRQTDAGGKAEFAAADGPGGLLVQADARPPLLLQLPRLVGEQRIVLRPGGTVAGQMLVDGRPAPPGLRLGLSVSFPGLAPNLPAAIAELLQSRWVLQSAAVTGPDGRFAFFGLAADWSGVLRTPQAYWVLAQAGQTVDEDQRSLLLRAPQHDLVVATTQLPTVPGRVVWADTGEGVPWTNVIALGQFADRPQSPVFGVQSDEQGRFVAGFHPDLASERERWRDPTRRSALTIVKFFVWGDPRSAGPAHAEADAERLREGREVVLRLSRASSTHFLVVDAAGKPIAGARVRCTTGGGASEPTTADGRGSFQGSRSEYIAGAPGYQVAPATPRAAAAGSPDDPLVFVLARANELVLRLRKPSGAVPEATRVELRSSEELFAGRRSQNELDRLFGSTKAECGRDRFPLAGGSSVWLSTAVMAAPANGDITLRSLVPAEPCTLTVRDALGTELLTQELVTPAAGERRELELAVTAERRRVIGRVLAAEGRPLSGAKVTLRSGHRETEVVTGGDGRFLFQVYTDTPLSVAARRAGFAPQQREALARDRDGEELEFVLTAGRRVTVRVVDDTGASVSLPVAIDTGTAAPSSLGAQQQGPGEWSFNDLPPSVTFICHLGGKRFDLRHDTAIAEAVLRVPRAALVVVAPPPDWQRPESGELAVLATRSDAAQEPVKVELEREGEAPARLLPGRYRFALVLVDWRRPDERRELGPAAEVELRAGEQTRVQLR